MKIVAGLGTTIDGMKIVKRRIERMKLPGQDEEQEVLDDAIKILEEVKERQEAMWAFMDTSRDFMLSVDKLIKAPDMEGSEGNG